MGKMGVDRHPRACGACTLCCRVLEIQELAKPADVSCNHIVAGRGCAIYGRHPASCRTFACLWLESTLVPEASRPDRSRVVLVMDADGTRLMAHCEPADALAWRREPVHGILRQRAQESWDVGTRVIAKAGDQMWLVCPDEDLDLGRIDPAAPYRIEETPAGELRVSILSPGARGSTPPVVRVLRTRRDQ